MATCIGSVPVRGWQRRYLATAAGKNSSEIGFSAESGRRRDGRRYLYRTPRYWRAPFACAARGLSLPYLWPSSLRYIVGPHQVSDQMPIAEQRSTDCDVDEVRIKFLQ